MVEGISAAAVRTAAATEQQPPTGDSPPSTSVGNGSLGKDAFLKLLVAQLKYQDPMAPQGSSEFLAQTAQFNMVEKLEELAKQTSELALQAGAQTAVSYLGRQVSYIDEDGQALTGTVSGTRLTADGPQLIVGGADVPLTSVIEVRAA